VNTLVPAVLHRSTTTRTALRLRLLRRHPRHLMRVAGWKRQRTASTTTSTTTKRG
jgi:hypothetical protein